MRFVRGMGMIVSVVRSRRLRVKSVEWEVSEDGVGWEANWGVFWFGRVGLG